MAKLILLRHGQSLWNAANKFTSWVDVPLSERGRAEATIVSCKLQDAGYQIDICLTSMLIRALETAVPIVYDVNSDGQITHKSMLDR
jgi:2,3-bisphosphoglycerate-dependent phosphoglycerate mutase